MNKITSGSLCVFTGLALDYAAIYGPKIFGDNKDLYCHEGCMCCIDRTTNEEVPFVD